MCISVSYTVHNNVHSQFLHFRFDDIAATISNDGAYSAASTSNGSVCNV